jgi:hypothetical protein
MEGLVRPGCLVVITSRNQLTGLVVAEAALPLRLDRLIAARGPVAAGPTGWVEAGSPANRRRSIRSSHSAPGWPS